MKRRLKNALAPRERRRQGTAAGDSFTRSRLGPGKGCSEDIYEAAPLDQAPLRKGRGAVRHGAGIRFATLNVQTLCRPTIHRQINDYMIKYGVDLLCLQETKVAAVTQYMVDEMLYVTMGHGGQGPEYAGVAYVFAKRMRPAITGFAVHAPGRVVSVGLDNMNKRHIQASWIHA